MILFALKYIIYPKTLVNKLCGLKTSKNNTYNYEVCYVTFILLVNSEKQTSMKTKHKLT